MSYYYTRDHLGSVREMCNSSGAIVARYSYDPYGRATLVSGTNLSTFQYAGYYTHQPSGLNLTRYRAYDPNTGHWLSRDPIAERGGINLYDYCHDDPDNYIDSLGLKNVNITIVSSGTIPAGAIAEIQRIIDDCLKCNKISDTVKMRFAKVPSAAEGQAAAGWGKNGPIVSVEDVPGGSFPSSTNGQIVVYNSSRYQSLADEFGAPYDEVLGDGLANEIFRHALGWPFSVDDYTATGYIDSVNPAIGGDFKPSFCKWIIWKLGLK